MSGMISNYLASYGIDPFYVKAGILALILILFLVLLIMQIRVMGKFKKLYRTYDHFMRGKDMESMEETVLAQFAVDAVTITVHKPHAPIGGPLTDTAVTIEMSRHA